MFECPFPSLPSVSLVMRPHGDTWDKHHRNYHDELDGVSNHQPHDYLLNRLFRQRLNKASRLRITGPCVGNSPVTGEFPAQRASNAQNVSIWWRHHDYYDSPPTGDNGTARMSPYAGVCGHLSTWRRVPTWANTLWRQSSGSYFCIPDILALHRHLSAPKHM